MRGFTLKLPALACLFLATTANSQTLEWASLTGSTIVDSKAEALQESLYLFEIGTFEEEFVPDETNVRHWGGTWLAFDTAEYRFNQTDFTGYFTASQNLQDVPGYVNMFQGLQAYLWIRNTANTEYFLATSASWIFPVLDADCCPTGQIQWSVSDLELTAPVWGSQLGVSGGGTGVNGVYDIQTFAVPEPSVALCLVFASGAAVMRRRRSRC